MEKAKESYKKKNFRNYNIGDYDFCSIMHYSPYHGSKVCTFTECKILMVLDTYIYTHSVRGGSVSVHLYQDKTTDAVMGGKLVKEKSFQEKI